MNIPYKKIQEGIPFLTVNKRLARTIHNSYDRYMKEKGQRVWESPAVLPLLSWLRELWTEYSREKFLLSSLRALVLWEKIVSLDKTFSGGELLSGTEVASTAYDAYRLVNDYGLDSGADFFSATEESRALQRWSAVYEEKLKELNFIDYSQLPFELAALIERDQVKVPPQLIVAGFDELSPAMSHLLKAFEKKNCQVHFWPPTQDPDNEGLPPSLREISLLRCTDEKEEVRRAAIEIGKTYRKGMKLGVLVPDLNHYKNEILSLFSEELTPLSILPWRQEKAPINISLGTRLYDEPVVRSALDLLTLDERRLEFDEISNLLLSPYLFFNEKEQRILARLDTKLRGDNRFNLTLNDLLTAARSLSGGEKSPASIEALRELSNSFRETRSSRLPSAWSEFFSNLLGKMNWPARAATLNSHEYQALQAFGNALSSLAGLDDITGAVKRKSALKYLVKITKETLFQPESEESPIKIMGILESAGMTFDMVWFLGAHDGLFPGQPSPNPFIPLKLQKDYDLPRSTFERELGFAKIQLQRILSSTEKLVASYPERVDDKEVDISPLLSLFEERKIDSEPGPGKRLIENISYAQTKGERETFSGLQVPENEAVRGGTAILKNQSDCPFRAFALHRLFSGRPEDPEPGISPMERGSLVHKAMEIFWNKVRDSNTLREIEENGRLPEVVAQSVGLALKEPGGVKGDSQSLREMEGERLASLLSEWIEIELKRSPFCSIESELEKELEIGGLHLSSRIDRIDCIDDRSKALIDYKTGSVSTADWAGKRPRDPQLMLYATTGNYDAILFARLKRGECRFTGIAKDEGLIPGIRDFTSDPLFKKSEHISSWEELMESWKATLQGLAQDFLAGKAHVDPRDYLKESSACKYCDQTLLCRISERNQQPSPEDDLSC